MTSTTPLLLLLLILLAGTLLFLVNAEINSGRISVDQLVAQLKNLPSVITDTRPEKKAPSGSEVPPDFVSGSSRFSQGICQEHSDCVVSGCSGEVCGSEEVVTTCELDESFPSSVSYDCRCLAQKCGWQPK